MTAALRRLWRSVGFRLAFYYGLLVAITMLAALAIVYMQTVGVLQQRMVRQVAASMQQLMVRYDARGADGVAGEISNALSDGRNSDNEIYLLTDREGNKLAGNLDQMPSQAPDAGDGVHRRVVRAGQTVIAYLVMRPLPDGGLLVVGHDLRDQESIESLVASASAAAGIVAVLLLIGGTFVFRQELERSVGAVRRTAARIAAGELQERVEPSGEEDEFALLEHDINAMLDRIQSLMDGVRHVSNTIAHNLRTPLTRVLVRLRAAEAGLGEDDPQREAVATAIRELEELAVVFEKLLQIAEVEAGARRQQFAPVELHVIADDVAELYEAVAELRGIVLLRDPADMAMALGDRDLLAGAAANLLDNALKYAGSGATVRVGTHTVDGRAQLFVQDDGPGIPHAEQERIGVRFHRLDRSVPGHGLGLASVLAVVALHGGRLDFADAKPGLRACIDLPMADG
ncbi:ATP-binding protein [Variovorax sp. NFACC27]|uniref:sensor histidine kinase n=1 Tax=unclassified Variovorax TaxID=663243 RepID=UPI00089675A5|nr:Signal transduction histidine kinase [Variovorax sp. NFACC28]SEG65668.1 Signal transduction histidine kinase [Variovorax sp. NFACC29]SFC69113.1 Signal transduction histidine kinase [Variovorax sp. NFACC26]SFG80017.1 Signal transduction histidine kinase [Variovorax sp. NFACC27]